MKTNQYMKKYILLTSLFLAILNPFIRAQSYFIFERITPKDIEPIKTRKLIVILAEPNPDDIGYYKTRKRLDEIDKLKRLCDTLNMALKESISTHWTFHTQATFMRLEEYKKAYPKGDKQHIIVHFASLHSPLYPHFNINIDTSKMKSREKLFSREQQVNYLVFVRGEKALSNYFRYFLLPESIPGHLSAFFMVGLCDFFFQAILEKGKKIIRKEMLEIMLKDKARLANKTLVIYKDWVAKSMTEEGIEAIYPYPVKLVDKEELIAIVRSKSANFVWYASAPIQEASSSSINNHISISYSHVHFLVDNATGNPLVMMHPYLHWPTRHKGREDRFLNEENLGKMVELMKQ